ncbi:hypothetical protein C0991_003310 [Blastosporella zonata]|nr:hypothetical protein C0991_003310 [Blastosporella zonata]
MFAAARSVATRIPRAATSHVHIRTFAEVAQAPSRPRRRPPKLANLLQETPLVENHGLYGFFRKKDNADELTGEAKYEVVEDNASRQKQTGRSWKASELRLKSFKDLHTLWYILLRERNLLATQKEEARRMGVQDTYSQVSTHRVYHTRKSMARIKAVLNERRLAYDGALKLVTEERDEKVDQELKSTLDKAWQRKRQAYLARRRELALAKQSAKAMAVNEDVKEEGVKEESVKKEDVKASPSATDNATQPDAPVPTPKPAARRVGGLLVDA